MPLSQAKALGGFIKGNHRSKAPARHGCSGRAGAHYKGESWAVQAEQEVEGETEVELQETSGEQDC